MVDIDTGYPPLLDSVAKSAGLVGPIAIGTFINRQLYVNKYLELLLSADARRVILVATLTYRHIFDLLSTVQHVMNMLTFSSSRIGEHSLRVLLFGLTNDRLFF